MAVISFKCPNCDGELIFDPETQKYKMRVLWFEIYPGRIGCIAAGRVKGDECRCSGWF